MPHAQESPSTFGIEIWNAHTLAKEGNADPDIINEFEARKSYLERNNPLRAAETATLLLQLSELEGTYDFFQGKWKEESDQLAKKLADRATTEKQMCLQALNKERDPEKVNVILKRIQQLEETVTTKHTVLREAWTAAGIVKNIIDSERGIKGDEGEKSPLLPHELNDAKDQKSKNVKNAICAYFEEHRKQHMPFLKGNGLEALISFLQEGGYLDSIITPNVQEYIDNLKIIEERNPGALLSSGSLGVLVKKINVKDRFNENTIRDLNLTAEQIFNDALKAASEEPGKNKHLKIFESLPSAIKIKITDAINKILFKRLKPVALEELGKPVPSIEAKPIEPLPAEEQKALIDSDLGVVLAPSLPLREKDQEQPALSQLPAPAKHSFLSRLSKRRPINSETPEPMNRRQFLAETSNGIIGMGLSAGLGALVTNHYATKDKENTVKEEVAKVEAKSEQTIKKLLEENGALHNSEAAYKSEINDLRKSNENLFDRLTEIKKASGNSR